MRPVSASRAWCGRLRASALVGGWPLPSLLMSFGCVLAVVCPSCRVGVVSFRVFSFEGPLWSLLSVLFLRLRSRWWVLGLSSVRPSARYSLLGSPVRFRHRQYGEQDSSTSWAARWPDYAARTGSPPTPKQRSRKPPLLLCARISACLVPLPLKCLVPLPFLKNRRRVLHPVARIC